MAAITTMVAIAGLGLGVASYRSQKKANSRALDAQEEHNATVLAEQEEAQAKNEKAARKAAREAKKEADRVDEATRLKGKRDAPGASVKFGSEDGMDTPKRSSAARRSSGKGRKTTSVLNSDWQQPGNKLIGGL